MSSCTVAVDIFLSPHLLICLCHPCEIPQSALLRGMSCDLHPLAFTEISMPIFIFQGIYNSYYATLFSMYPKIFNNMQLSSYVLHFRSILPMSLWGCLNTHFPVFPIFKIWQNPVRTGIMPMYISGKTGKSGKWFCDWPICAMIGMLLWEKEANRKHGHVLMRSQLPQGAGTGSFSQGMTSVLLLQHRWKFIC